MYDARLCPREGDQRLSAKKRSESEGAGQSRRSKKFASSGTGGGRGGSGGNRGGRGGGGTNEIGRALRTIYDDTLREPVPDDFADLIGKLS